MIDIKRLRELCEKATPGPWRADTCGYGDFTPDRACSIRQVSESAESGFWGIVHDTSYDDCCHMMRATDAAFIVEARNALPALLDELERLRARDVEARELLDHAEEELGFAKDETMTQAARRHAAWCRRRDAFLAPQPTGDKP